MENVIELYSLTGNPKHIDEYKIFAISFDESEMYEMLNNMSDESKEILDFDIKSILVIEYGRITTDNYEIIEYRIISSHDMIIQTYRICNTDKIFGVLSNNLSTNRLINRIHNFDSNSTFEVDPTITDLDEIYFYKIINNCDSLDIIKFNEFYEDSIM
jgi:hypothetical protein